MSESLEKESKEDIDSQKLTEAKEDSLEIVETNSNQFEELFQENDIVEFESGESFEILATLGRGGMGQVYMAKNCQTNETVALKTLNKEFQHDKVALKRFKLEAETAKCLEHKNVASVFDFQTTKNGDSMIVMEYVKGESLRTNLDNSGVMDEGKALDLFIDIAEAIGYAHDNGIIHRDIKPSNIVLGEDNEGEAKILDFGIAKVDSISSRETQDLTRTGGVFGSPYYMSPEQCLGFRLDQRSDIYSLGCLMYEVISGKPPFAGTNPMQLVVSHINENPNRLDRQYRTTNKGSKLENVIFRCLAKEQKDRYQSVKELKQDLELIKDDKEIPKYDTKKNIKAAYSLTSIAYVAAAICLTVLVVSVFPSDILPGEFWYYLQGAAFTLLSVTGSYIFLNIFKQKLKSFDNLKASLKDWFTLLFALFSGLTALAGVPYMLAGYFSYKESVPFFSFFGLDSISVVMFSSMLIASITVLLAMISGACRFVFKSGKKVSFVKPTSILLILAVLVIPLLPQIAPKAVTGFTYRLAYFAIRTAPQTAIKIYDYSFDLDSRKGLPAHIISIHNQHDDFKSAIAVASKYMEYYKERDRSLYDRLLAERAFLYDRDGQYNSAIRDANYLIANSPATRSLAYAVKANVESEQGNYNQALKVIDQALAVDPSYTGYSYPVKIGILCKYGQYEKALSLINNIEKRSSRRVNWDCASGIIYDKMGQKELADTYFRKSYTEYKNLLKAKDEKMHNFRNPRLDERLSAAYAAHRLGLIDESNKILEKGSDFEFPPRKKELMERLFNYSWDHKVSW